MAFGDTIGGYVGGLGKAWLSGVGMDALSGTYPETVFIMFQLTFAIITPALFVGGIAERMRFSAMLIFVAAWVLLVYFPVAHWVWGGGWLADIGFRDFAGGAVVHVTAGVAALVAALVLGNRSGFPDTPMPPHNLPMTVTGACMLWVGWFGFNAGSALAADGAAGMAMLVTHIGASLGSLTWMACEWVRYGKPSVLGIVTGMVAGLATITPASGFVGPLGALVIGIAGGLGCFLATQFIKRKLKIDDSLDVFPVHAVGGMIGLVVDGDFLCVKPGRDGPRRGRQRRSINLACRSWASSRRFAWCAALSFVLLKAIDAIVPLRVSRRRGNRGPGHRASRGTPATTCSRDLAYGLDLATGCLHCRWGVSGSP